MYTLRDNQARAFKNITKYNGDRCQYISACGTGKTLVSKELIVDTFNFSPGIIIVFVPSLALMNQTSSSFYDYGLDSTYKTLFVCSDTEMGSTIKDHLDFSFVTTTEKEIISNQLELLSDEKVVIFCTYHSSRLLSEVIKSKNISVLLGIYDEAHKTTSIRDTNFNYSLLNKNIDIKKRIFMTATPKHTSYDDDDIPSFSMNNESLYGPVVENYSMRQAIKDNIITQYRVIVSIIDNDLMHRMNNDEASDSFSGDLKRSGKLYALVDAIKKYNIKKTILFSERINKSKKYTEGLNTVFPEKRSVHVDSTSGNSFVSQALDDLRTGKISILSNATILSEGVDVPSIEMSAFMEKTKSAPNIIQRIGRATRKDQDNPNKIGYIFLPIFIGEIGDNLVDAAIKAGMEDVLRILHTLYENDEYFSEVINSFSGPEKDGGVSEKMEGLISFLGGDNYVSNISHFKDKLYTVIVENILPTWEQNFLSTKQFIIKNKRLPYNKERYGGINVHSWINNQRVRMKKEKLTEDEKSKLHSIGVFTDVELWKFNYNLYFEEFQKREDPKYKPTEPLHGVTFSNWENLQRFNRRTGKLSKEKLLLLNKINFIWNKIEKQWEDNFTLYLSLKSKNKEEPFLVNLSDDPTLYYWCNRQRKTYLDKSLSQDYIKRLSDVDFIWDLNNKDIIWNESLKKYIDFKNKYKREPSKKDVSAGIIPMSLIGWIGTQKKALRRGTILPDRKSRLFKTNIVLDTRLQDWENMFSLYIDWKNMFPNKEPSSTVVHKGKNLGIWVSGQRYSYKKNNLSMNYIKKLEESGFIWSLESEDVFDEFLKIYIAFSKKNKRGPIRGEIFQDKEIGVWAANQVGLYNDNDLKKEKKKQMDDINFEMDLSYSRWLKGYYIFLDFMDKSKEDFSSRTIWDGYSLGTWVSRQRKLYSEGTLSKKREILLISIGFIFNVNEARWNTMLSISYEFVSKHGRLPTTQEEYKGIKVGTWFCTQHRKYKKNTLNTKKEKILFDKFGLFL